MVFRSPLPNDGKSDLATTAKSVRNSDAISGIAGRHMSIASGPTADIQPKTSAARSIVIARDLLGLIPVGGGIVSLAAIGGARGEI